MTSAKDASLAGQIIGAVIIVIGFALKGFKVIELSGFDIMACGLGAAGMFAPVYLSIIIDKIKASPDKGKRRRKMKKFPLTEDI